MPFYFFLCQTKFLVHKTWVVRFLQHFLSPLLAQNTMSIWKVVGNKFMFPVKSMVLMYITHFKLFGYHLPFWRKMQTKLKVRNENAPGITFLGITFFLVCFDLCLNFDSLPLISNAQIFNQLSYTTRLLIINLT